MKNFNLILFLFLSLILSSCEDDTGLPLDTIPIGSDGKCQENNGQLNANVIIDDLRWKHYLDARDVDEVSNAQTVGQLIIPAAMASCTAFLINENTIMTNNHCISNSYGATGAVFKVRDQDGNRENFSCENFILTNSILDFTLVSCQKSPGKKYGYVALSSRVIEVNDDMYVVQENCNYMDDPRCIVDKYLAFGVINTSRTSIIGHDADTLPGSSGSPIFAADSNELIAIHNAGKQASSRSPASNFGVPMYRIREHIKQNAPQVIIYDFVSDGTTPTPTPSPAPPAPLCPSV